MEKTVSRKMIYGSKENPPPRRLIIYALQWIAFSTYPIMWGLVLVGFGLKMEPMVLSGYVTATVFTIAISSLAQTIFGHRCGMLSGPNILPGFTILAAFSLGYPTGEIFGAFVIGSGMVVVLALCGAIGYLRKLFTPLALGTLVMMIGLSAAKLGISLMVSHGGTFVLVALLLTLICGYIGTRLQGFISTIPVFIIVLIGYIVFIAAGRFDWGLVKQMPTVVLPRPMLLGLSWPDAGLIVSAAIAQIAAAFFCLGNVLSVHTVIEEEFDFKKSKSTVAILGGVEGVLASVFSATPLVPYSGNIGFVSITRVASRSSVILASAVLAVLSVIGPVSGLLASIPKPVAGAVLMGIAGMNIGIGARIWGAGTPTFDTQQVFIVGFAVFTALGFASLPQSYFDQMPRTLAQIINNPMLSALLYVIVLESLIFRRRSALA